MERQQGHGSGDRAAAPISIGVDVGGTFTDVVWIGEGRPLAHMKVPTTRAAPGVAIKNAILRAAETGAFNPAEVVRFGHGTTVATNAVLERKGAKTGLLTTAGFRDVLEIGRSFRTNMYDLFVKTNAPVFLAPLLLMMAGYGFLFATLWMIRIRTAILERRARNLMQAGAR